MKFLCIYKPSKPEGGPHLDPSEMEKMGVFVNEMKAKGILQANDGCMPSQFGARIRLDNGKTSVKDGPFTESKELIAGFAVIKVASKEEAIEVTKRFLTVAGDGETEIRQVFERPEGQ